MVEKSFNMLNMKPELSLYTNMVNEDNNSWPASTPLAHSLTVKISKNNNYNNKDKNPKDNYVKVLIEDPFNNREIILKVSKKQKGVYLWESLDSKQKYLAPLGHSINLYNRISSYFMPSILKTKARRVLRYFNNKCCLLNEGRSQTLTTSQYLLSTNCSTNKLNSFSLFSLCPYPARVCAPLRRVINSSL